MPFEREPTGVNPIARAQKEAKRATTSEGVVEGVATVVVTKGGQEARSFRSVIGVAGPEAWITAMEKAAAMPELSQADYELFHPTDQSFHR